MYENENSKNIFWETDTKTKMQKYFLGNGYENENAKIFFGKRIRKRFLETLHPCTKTHDFLGKIEGCFTFIWFPG